MRVDQIWPPGHGQPTSALKLSYRLVVLSKDARSNDRDADFLLSKTH